MTALYPPLSKASINQQINWNQIPVPNKTSEEWEAIRKELAQPIEEVYYSVIAINYLLEMLMFNLYSW